MEESSLAQQLGGQPILILKDGAQRNRNRDANSVNIMAAKAVAEAVRTTLGPKGMDKMLVDSGGDVIITNDGATILKEIDIEHPAAKMIVEVAKTQDDEVGDGTTTAVVLTGELLKRSEELIEQDIHPSVIIQGYLLASEKAKEFITENAHRITPDDVDSMKRIALTAMTGKSTESNPEKLAGLCVAAVRAIADEDNKVNIDNIKVDKHVGGRVTDSELVHGIVVDKEVAHPDMPTSVKNAKIALLNCKMEIEKTEIDANIKITSPDQLKEFMDNEEQMLLKMADTIKKSGANVVLSEKEIDDISAHRLAKYGILAIKKITDEDLKKLAKATGGKPVSSLESLSPEELGSAGLVEEVAVGDEKWIFVRECEGAKAVSLILRGATKHIVDEVERAVHDGLRVVGVALEDGSIVAGGGASEVELSLRLREYAASLGGREQLAAEAFAEAMEIIPLTLAENAGLDPIDTLVELRSRHESGGKDIGLNSYTGKSTDMFKEGVVEPLRVKTQAIGSAAETAIMVLRIDDVIMAGELGK